MFRSTLRLTLTAVTLGIAGWFLYSSSFGQNQEAADSGSAQEGNLLVQRAEIFLNLQKAKLKQSEALNRRMANSVSEAHLNNLKLNVELGERLLDAVRDSETDARKSTYLILAKNAVSSAEDELERAEQVHRQIKGRVSAEDLEVLRFKAELAKMNLQIGEQSIDRSSEDELRWKVDLLFDEVLRLRSAMKQIRSN